MGGINHFADTWRKVEQRGQTVQSQQRASPARSPAGCYPGWVPTGMPVGTQVPASGLADFYL
jgi:hypothetical protein